MCGRFFRENISWEEYRETALGILEPPDGAFPPHDDIRPTTLQPVVALGREGPALVVMRWDFLPHWWSKPPREKTFTTFNARIETVAASKTFSRAWTRAQRCLVPASGWYEWKAEEGARKKRRHIVRLADRSAFAFAGLWERARVSGEDVFSFTLLTTASSGAMADLHHRTPFPLRPAEGARWLTVEDPTPPPPPGEVLIEPVDA